MYIHVHTTVHVYIHVYMHKILCLSGRDIQVFVMPTCTLQPDLF